MVPFGIEMKSERAILNGESNARRDLGGYLTLPSFLERRLCNVHTPRSDLPLLRAINAEYMEYAEHLSVTESYSI